MRKNYCRERGKRKQQEFARSNLYTLLSLVSRYANVTKYLSKCSSLVVTNRNELLPRAGSKVVSRPFFVRGVPPHPPTVTPRPCFFPFSLFDKRF